MAKITDVKARWILDSRGQPTVEAEVIADAKYIGRAAVPSGASTGSREAIELRDGDSKLFNGMGVNTTVENVNKKIRPALLGYLSDNQAEIDGTIIALDGSANKSKLGANACLAVSLAAAKSAAKSKSLPFYKYVSRISGQEPSLPLPMINMLNGGVHASDSTDIQEFMVLPVSAKSFEEGIRRSSEVFQSLKKIARAQGWGTNVGDEGGFVPKLHSNQAGLDTLCDAISGAGYKPGADFVLAIDVAASEILENKHYNLKLEAQSLTSQQMVAWLSDLRSQYPLVSIEDGLGEDDWEGWTELASRLAENTQIVGDDLLVTNTQFIQTAITKKAANALLIKPNQIGTLTETIKAFKLAKSAGWSTIISHRSGETEDTSIAHLAVGLGAGQIKTGSLSRGERTAKYNELLRIEEHLGKSANYLKLQGFKWQS